MTITASHVTSDATPTFNTRKQPKFYSIQVGSEFDSLLEVRLGQYLTEFFDIELLSYHEEEKENNTYNCVLLGNSSKLNSFRDPSPENKTWINTSTYL